MFNLQFDPQNYASQDSWNQHWYERNWELIEKYDPDMFNNDSPYPSIEKGKGLGVKLFPILFAATSMKTMANKRRFFIQRCESGQSGIYLQPGAWQRRGNQTLSLDVGNRSIGRMVLSQAAQNKMSIPVMIGNAVDAISKNGVVMMNVRFAGRRYSARQPGCLSDAMGDFLKINGEGIYETRPWKTFGEGPLKMKDGRQGENHEDFSPQDIRFTQKGEMLYAFVLAPPTEDILIKSLAIDGPLNREIASLELMGSDEAIAWQRSASGLAITLPEKLPGEIVNGIRIRLKPAESKPNVVVIVADDMGWGDSATYGNELIQTPNLDRLASEGVKLTQAYSAAGVCSPSRSAILTGRTPYRNGVYRHLSGNHEAHLRASEITYPELVKNAGYETAHVGKWHLLSKNQFNNPDYPQPGDHGYDYWLYTQNNASPSHENPDNFFRNGEPVGETESYSAQFVAAEASHWLQNLRDPKKPFVLSVWFHEPHAPIATDSRFETLYAGHENSKYMGNITQLDHALGMVLDALDDAGVSDNTLVFFTSDNGPVPKFGGSSGGLRGIKRHEYEGGIRVPGLARWPGRIEAGSVSDVPVIGSDIFSTVLDIVGLPLPSDRTIDGVSMIPALSGKSVDRKIPMFWRTHVSPPDQRVAMRIGDWKIVGDETLTKFQLYEVQTDWQEKNDLANELPEKTEEMKDALLALWADIVAEGPNEWWEEETQPPMADGVVSY